VKIINGKIAHGDQYLLSSIALFVGYMMFVVVVRPSCVGVAMYFRFYG